MYSEELEPSGKPIYPLADDDASTQHGTAHYWSYAGYGWNIHGQPGVIFSSVLKVEDSDLSNTFSAFEQDGYGLAGERCTKEVYQRVAGLSIDMFAFLRP